MSPSTDIDARFDDGVHSHDSTVGQSTVPVQYSKPPTDSCIQRFIKLFCRCLCCENQLQTSQVHPDTNNEHGLLSQGKLSLKDKSNLSENNPQLVQFKSYGDEFRQPTFRSLNQEAKHHAEGSYFNDGFSLVTDNGHFEKQTKQERTNEETSFSSSCDGNNESEYIAVREI